MTPEQYAKAKEELLKSSTKMLEQFISESHSLDVAATDGNVSEWISEYARNTREGMAGEPSGEGDQSSVGRESLPLG